MADLFGDGEPGKALTGAPLADRLRPKSLAEVVGQEHLTGRGRRADAADPLGLARFDDLLGTARHRQDDGGAAACRRDEPGL